MNTAFVLWLISTLFWTAVMGFYSMQEMACISCNKLRLDYYVAQKQRWARLLQYLLERPTILFSTSLIGVNVALMVSSESARRLFEAVGVDPNWAPIAEIPFVLIFGELVPMFAARLYPDHVCRLGIPFLYLSAKLFSPVIAVIDFFFQQVNVLAKKKEGSEHAPVLSRDELQKLLEEHHFGYPTDAVAVVGEEISNIFSMRFKRAIDLMQHLEYFPCVSAHTTVASIRKLATSLEHECVLVYHRSRQKIVGIVYLRDLLSASDTKKVREYAKSPCFVTQDTQALDLIFQLPSEEVQDAVVLNPKGEALGIILLEDLLDELLGTEVKPLSMQKKLRYLEKTCQADTSIKDFNDTYNTAIDPQGCTTFAELIEKVLGRHPALNDSLFLDPLEIVVQETSLFRAKTLLIRTKRQ